MFLCLLHLNCFCFDPYHIRQNYLRHQHQAIEVHALNVTSKINKVTRPQWGLMLYTVGAVSRHVITSHQDDIVGCNVPTNLGYDKSPEDWFGVTYWGRDKMAAIFQTTFSNGFLKKSGHVRVMMHAGVANPRWGNTFPSHTQTAIFAYLVRGSLHPRSWNIWLFKSKPCFHFASSQTYAMPLWKSQHTRYGMMRTIH